MIVRCQYVFDNLSIRCGEYLLYVERFVVQSRERALPKCVKRPGPETGTNNSVHACGPVCAFASERTLDARFELRNIHIDKRTVHHLLGNIGWLVSSIPTDRPEVINERCQVSKRRVGMKGNMLLKSRRIQMSSRVIIFCGFL